jgi:RimJ/RimL family protein N-acetyltransferase
MYGPERFGYKEAFTHGFESYPVGRVSAVMGGREAEEAGGCLSRTPLACATPGWRTSFRVLVTRPEQVGSALESSVNTARYQAAFANSFGTRHSTPRQLPLQLSRPMRHSMPIVTPRLILRPAILDDLDAIQAAKEDAWNDLQLWMAWAFDNQRPRQALEQSIRRVMNFQSQAGIALAGFHRINGDFVVRTALDLTDEADVYETGYWVARKYAGQGMATEAANAAIRYAFGRLGAKAISIGHFDGNDASRRIVEKLGFQKLRIARHASTRPLDGKKLDRHEYILTSPDVLPKLDVSWG